MDKERISQRIADKGTSYAREKWQRKVMKKDLPLTIPRCKKRADYSAFFIDGGGCKHHKHERQNSNKQVHECHPHNAVAIDIVLGISNAIVRVAIKKFRERHAVIFKHIEHILLEIGALGIG